MIVPTNSKEVIKNDLNYICKNLEEEFPCISGKNLLITGGAGFLGYYLVQSVLEWNQTVSPSDKIHVTVYDNYIRGIPEWLINLKGNRYLKLVKHDITNVLPEDMDDFQYIIHAASIASPAYYRKYPIETMDANVNGLRILLEYCRRQKENKKELDGFLFYSSSEIYGDPQPENIPTPESYHGYVSSTGPRACYDESKRFGETLCVNFAKKYDLPIKIVRPFNNYGPGLKITDKRVIPDFAQDIFSNKDVVMYSDGTPQRTFCYISDAVIGYYKTLVKGGKGEAYNIGVEKPEMSMIELARLIVSIARDKFNYHGKVVQEKSKEINYLLDNPNRRCPNIDKARRELGYNPGVSIEEGLLKSLTWYSENLQSEEA